MPDETDGACVSRCLGERWNESIIFFHLTLLKNAVSFLPAGKRNIVLRRKYLNQPDNSERLNETHDLQAYYDAQYSWALLFFVLFFFSPSNLLNTKTAKAHYDVCFNETSTSV